MQIHGNSWKQIISKDLTRPDKVVDQEDGFALDFGGDAVPEAKKNSDKDIPNLEEAEKIRAERKEKKDKKRQEKADAKQKAKEGAEKKERVPFEELPRKI